MKGEVVFQDLVRALQRVPGDAADLWQGCSGQRHPDDGRRAEILFHDRRAGRHNLRRLGADLGEEVAIGVVVPVDQVASLRWTKMLSSLPLAFRRLSIASRRT